MATDALRTDIPRLARPATLPREATRPVWKEAEQFLRPLASLRITVALFALAIFLIFVGTLAQTSADVWVVVREYFRAWLAWVPLQVFFPKSFFPNLGAVPGGFYFPGGFTIGTLMAINLLAAHGLRFKIQAKGARLWAGLGVIAAGMVITWLVIIGQQDSASLTVFASSNWQPVWVLFKVVLAAVWAGCAYRLFTAKHATKWERRALSVAGIAAGATFCWLMYLYLTDQEWPLGGSSMRILWQLTKGAAAAAVLLAGCIMVFRKRGGIVLLHAGVLLMMANELVVYGMHVESSMTIREGETKNWVQDIRATELAVVETSQPDVDHAVVIPRAMLQPGQVIHDERLPFDVRMEEYFINSELVDAEPKLANPATAGNGLDIVAVSRRPGTGTDANPEVDYPAAYVTLLDKQSGEEIGTYLTSAMLNELGDMVPPERIKLGDKKYDLSLRFERHYKPYSVTLIDVRKDDYPGTDTPRNYSSDVRLVDQEAGVDREVKIWMNNPHRYGGDTFYQTSYHRDAKGELTSLSVVSNRGWMVPYVACMIVVVGLLAHFSITLLRFIKRRTEVELASVAIEPRGNDKARRATATPKVTPARGFEAWLPKYFPLLVVLILGGWAIGKWRTPSAESGGMDLYAAGKLPIMYQGRAKPLDTLARQTMCVMSNRQTTRVVVPNDKITLAMKLFGDGETKAEPAIKWLLDTIAKAPRGEQHRIIRIDNTDVLNTLGLEPRQGFRYSIDEIRPKYERFQEEVAKARDVDEESRSTYEKKLLEVDNRIRSYTLVTAAFWPAPLPPFPTEAEFKADQQKAIEAIRQIGGMRDAVLQMHGELNRMNPPRAVPDSTSEFGWNALSIAKDREYFQKLDSTYQPPAPLKHWDAILTAYREGNAMAFNRAVERYQSYLDEHGPDSLRASAPQLEAFFNNAEPFYYAAVLYLFAFVLSALAWLGWSRPFNRAAFWLLAFTFAYHTVALCLRMYISGRPPVTNLYSSAVFIGWACVLFGLIFERVYRMGLGNTVAAVAGSSTLVIAHLLMTQAPANGGDTMAVLQAVLDTQFWLATHVVCVTLGYAATFMAGLFGLLYVIRGVLTRSLTSQVAKDLSRMTYGTICFAIFFSFFGTVLGGLWADDSWGRFWGWDPKENGALIIVLWNALVLHARWAGMVKDRGLAVLAIGGNIVTAWSWFGVNELRVGLHSYGFTEGALLVLGTFVLSQMIAIAIGSLPKRNWSSAATLNAAA
jgi:ABC-type transport system involved in cytochrome c biogenesis permease subunit